jgi:hypothetical protein
MKEWRRKGMEEVERVPSLEVIVLSPFFDRAVPSVLLHVNRTALGSEAWRGGGSSGKG